jgi:hypothetical protein
VRDPEPRRSALGVGAELISADVDIPHRHMRNASPYQFILHELERCLPRQDADSDSAQLLERGAGK